MIKIIGGSGFIGTRLCKRLKNAGKEFRIIDKVKSKSFPNQCVIADLRDLEAMEKFIEPEDVIINLAAEHRDDVTPKSLYDEVNVGGAKNVCRIADERGVKTIIFTSSVAVYGFAPPGTNENGKINYFNDYGRTKFLAELVYKEWFSKDPKNRKLVIVRPTVVFGEQNRGNVYNLLHHIASGKFIMIGDGKNVKSMAYVENVAAFLEYCLGFKNGFFLYNYVDKPDFDMNTLVSTVKSLLGKGEEIGFRLPFVFGYGIGKVFDFISAVTGVKFGISSIRVKKFCSNTMFETSIYKTGFVPPVKLEEGLKKTIKYDFLQKNDGELFYTE